MSGANEVFESKDIESVLPKETDYLKVRGVSASKKEALKNLAMARFGKSNASLLIRYLIDDELNKKVGQGTVVDERQKFDLIKSSNSTQKLRLEIKITESEKRALEYVAAKVESSPQHYLVSLLRGHLSNVSALTGNEITALRESNYQLASIGRNINQVARKMNANIYDENMITKVINLADEYKAHIELVANVLRANLERWDISGDMT